MTPGWLLRPGSVAVVLAMAFAVPGAQSDGWTIGRDAADLTNPLPLATEHLARGAELYRTHCQRCHGRTGRGNGPDADPDDPPRDLTDPRRAVRNPDGVLFYKIWYGRRNPRMPAFRTEMSPDDVWTVVHYVKSLRETAGSRQ